ncbi:MAG: hypothetical protein ACPLRU_06195, partial [Desulfofundulus sp.]
SCAGWWFRMVHAAQGWYITSTYYVTLTWRPSRSTDTARYEIWAAPRKGGPYFMTDIIDDRLAHQHTLANMPAGVYYFVMTSVDKSGNRSLQSNEVSVFV